RIEPTSEAWEASILPLNYPRWLFYVGSVILSGRSFSMQVCIRSVCCTKSALGRLPVAAICDDCHLKVLGETNNTFGKILSEQPFSQISFRVRYEDLRDLVLPCEFHDGFGDVLTGNRSGLNLQTSGEAEMLLYRHALVRRQIRKVLSRVHE